VAALILALICARFSPADELADLRAAMERAPALDVERVCAPIKSTRGGQHTLVPNPDGKSYDVLVRYYDGYWGPHTTVIVDLGTGEVKQEVVEKALYQTSIIGPDGKLYGHRTAPGGTGIWVYDPAVNATTLLPERAPVDGETRPLTIGTDGKIYGAGSLRGRACAYQLDPATGKVTDFGLMGPSHEPNACWGYSVAADDRYVYVASGKIPWYCVAYDRETKTESVLLTLNDARGHLSVNQQRYGCVVTTKTGDGKSEAYWLHNGKAIPKKDAAEKAPWPEPTPATPWVNLPPAPEISTGALIPKADGQVTLWYRTAEAKAAAPKTAAEDAAPEALGWKCVKYEVSTYAAPIHRVTALPDGRITGSGGSYLGCFLYDPKTNQSQHLGRFGLSHYCSAVAGGLVYMSGYPSSALYVFDPNKPWTIEVSEKPGQAPLRDDAPASNARRVSYLAHEGAGTHKMWTAAVGADGRVYFGGRWYRNGEGGGLGWWDPKTQKAGGISEPFANYQISHITAAQKGRYIIVSTLAVRDQATGRIAPPQGKLFVFDTAEGKIVRACEPVKGALFAGAIAGGEGDVVLGLTYDPEAPDLKPWEIPWSILYGFDVVTGKVTFRKRLPWAVGFLTNENFDHNDGFDFQTGPDGRVWTFLGGKMEVVNPEIRWGLAYAGARLVKIDPRTGSVEVVGKVDRCGEMAFQGKDLYLSGGSKYYAEGNEYLRRIRGVVK
jgi:hypothetical protein